jgi:hypothetical protein
VGQGETVGADDLLQAIQAMMEMFDQWRTDNLMCWVVEQVAYNLTPGQQTYTIGPGAYFDRQRPIFMDNASLIWQTSSPYPVEIPLEVITVEQWQQIPVKNITSTIPRRMYYEERVTGMTNDWGTIYLWPIPQVGNVKIKLYAPTENLEDINSLPDLSVMMPQGYATAIRLNLAMDLAAEYDELEIPSWLPGKAIAAKTDIEAVNDRPVIIGCDAAVVGRGGFFNYYTGETGSN